MKMIKSLKRHLLKLKDKKKLFRLLLRIQSRISSPIYNLHNFFQVLNKVDQRIYKMKDPFNKIPLYSPTYGQLEAMRRDLLLRNQYFNGISKIAKINRSKLIIDVGANIGYYSRACSKYTKGLQIIGIEPDLKNLAYCSMNLRDRNDISLFQMGLGEDFGRFNVSIPNYAKKRLGESKFNTGLMSAIGNETKEGIRFFKLDEFCKFMRIEFRDISWIKIDVEGFELKVLRGMEELLKNSICPIEIELNCRALNLSNTKFNDLLQIFEKFDYYPLRNKDIDVDIEIPRLKVMDLVFVKTEIKDIAKSTLNLVDFSSAEISNWNCAFDKEYIY